MAICLLEVWYHSSDEVARGIITDQLICPPVLSESKHRNLSSNLPHLLSLKLRAIIIQTKDLNLKLYKIWFGTFPHPVLYDDSHLH